MAAPRILIVEDDEKLVELIAEYFRMHGFEPAIALDGVSALAMAATLLPDMILLDLRLPNVDGLEVVRQLQAAPATRAIPIMVLSAQSSFQVREASMAAGCKDYMVKPVQLAALLHRVEKLLGRQSS